VYGDVLRSSKNPQKRKRSIYDSKKRRREVGSKIKISQATTKKNKETTNREQQKIKRKGYLIYVFILILRLVRSRLQAESFEAQDPTHVGGEPETVQHGQ